MLIIIRENNSFMPSTTITIRENVIAVEENAIVKELKYSEEKIKQIFNTFLLVFKYWNSKYVDSKIIDDDTYEILVINNERKEYFIKNKYPSNWEKFLFLKNKLLREEL